MADDANTVRAHDARAVANYFLEKAKKNGTELTHLQLQKLVYFAHGWTLAVNKKNLIRDAVEAWEHGPVIRTVYDAFKKYGGKPITEFAKEFDLQTRDFRRFETFFTENESAIMDRVWEVYGHLEAFQLSNLTHKSDTPWDQIRKKGDTVIPNDMIRSYFESKLKTANVN